MGSLFLVRVNDERERREALDPRRSFIVQAPAGSGKTELLIQRYLKLLSSVDRPERIFAMTFTRKAAAEMRERILSALISKDDSPLAPHEQETHELAVAAMARNEELDWKLLDNPGRIKVQTIDALCGSLVAQMPWLARQGALPEIIEDATALYRSAAQRTVLMVEQEVKQRDSIEHLLLHLDNKTSRAVELVSAMLAKRDQWITFAFETDEESRADMERILRQVVDEAHEAVEQSIPPFDLIAIREAFGDWENAVECLLTKAGTWRKDLSRKLPVGLAQRLEETEGLRENLVFIRKLPPRSFSDAQWKTLRSLLEVLKLAVGQLRVSFHEAGCCDFGEMTLAARGALGAAENPSELALKLDARIDHLLIDEFQDTSVGQFELAESLIAGWQANDGRTLFVVGDPMQSIYRFRQAEVGLFLQTATSGIGAVRPEELILRANYRSARGIVEWVNRVFGSVFPTRSEAHTGAVSYSASDATRADEASPVELHAFPEKDTEQEAKQVVVLIREAFEKNPKGVVAILVRARSHLPAIVRAIKRGGLSFRAVKIDDLGQRQVARDLLSLTRAMLHLGDRVAWLAVLRAPWCGLCLADLHTLAGGDTKALVYDLLRGDLKGLSRDGRLRATRARRVLNEAFEQRGRVALRVWIAGTWRALGGEACLQSTAEVKDAADFFDLLEREQAGSDLRDFDGFAISVDTLKAQADPQADERLQVMTIHEAKGLQFDTVILPGLGRGSARDSTELFLYHEGLMAPIKESGSDDDPVYQYLKEIEKRKSANELVRLLYVAATRAKKQLHLSGYVQRANGKPPAGSLLGVLWKGLGDGEKQKFIDAAVANAVGLADEPVAPALRRMPLGWSAPPAVPPVKWARGEERVDEEREPTFEWVGDSLRHAGTVVHEVLQRIARDGKYRAAPDVIRVALAQLGVPGVELERTAERVESAVAKTLGSERGRWILSAHREARSEMAVAATVGGQVLSGRIDRTFVDGDGVRWVIDFKTSWHEGGKLTEFLDEQQRRYRGQMERYGQLFSRQSAAVRLGLYFPLLDEWREWGI